MSRYSESSGVWLSLTVSSEHEIFFSWQRRWERERIFRALNREEDVFTGSWWLDTLFAKYITQQLKSPSIMYHRDESMVSFQMVFWESPQWICSSPEWQDFGLYRLIGWHACSLWRAKEGTSWLLSFAPCILPTLLSLAIDLTLHACQPINLYMNRGGWMEREYKLRDE